MIWLDGLEGYRDKPLLPASVLRQLGPDPPSHKLQSGRGILSLHRGDGMWSQLESVKHII
jgi:hypothetical protein